MKIRKHEKVAKFALPDFNYAGALTTLHTTVIL
jgi:hypothetical protein